VYLDVKEQAKICTVSVFVCLSLVFHRRELSYSISVELQLMKTWSAACEEFLKYSLKRVTKKPSGKIKREKYKTEQEKEQVRERDTEREGKRESTSSGVE